MTSSFKLLRLLTVCSILVASVLWVIFFYLFFSNGYYTNTDAFLLHYPRIFVCPTLIVFSIIIVVKANPNKGILLYALFLTAFSQNICLQLLLKVMASPYWGNIFWVSIIGGVAGTLYIKSLQYFPRQVTDSNINMVFPRSKLISGFARWTLKNYTWILFPVIITSGYYFSATSAWSGLLDVFIMLSACLSLYVNYKNSTPSERNKILWLFWGLLSYTFLYIISVIIGSFYPGDVRVFKLIMTFISHFLLLISLVMSLFYSNAFDTGHLIRRTIVDGSIFILIVLIYNTLEHYFLHWLSETLHLSNVLISSFMSGFFVLIFTPVHHKLMHFAKRKVKITGHDHE